MFHLTREQITGRTNRDLFPPGQAAAFRLNDRKVLEAGIPLEFEEVAQHDDGPHTSIVFKFPLCDTEGRTYAIGGMTTDITDRKGMEHALRESQARLALALDARQQLDADLHDNIIQMLYAVGMNLEQSRHLLHYNVTAADDTLKGALSNLNHVIEDVRGYIGSQEPPRLCGNQLDRHPLRLDSDDARGERTSVYFANGSERHSAPYRRTIPSPVFHRP